MREPMSEELALGGTISLPAPPAGWFDYGFSVRWDGNLVLVRTDCDFYTKYAHWLDQAQGGDFHGPKPDLRDARLRRSQFCFGVADGEGFEPSVPCGTHALQACPIDHSGTHPKRAYEFGVD
jgi:hypothetical protein